MRRPSKSAAAIGVSLLAAGSLLFGCGAEQVAEQIGEQAINGEVDIEDDSISITDDEGNEFSAGSGTEIPDSWPETVPLFPGGELVLATSQSEGSATALWETSQSIDEAAAAYDATLISSGFTLDQDANIDGTIVRSYRGDAIAANVTVADVEGTTNVSIVVVPAS